jgi:peptidoglycan biosynthesis protein MviN/MurJ (putative lipid II flippase)
MYEIWLMLNIVWEIALGVWPVLLLAALLWLALLGRSWRTTGAHWRAALPPALGIGLVMAVVTALMLPGWMQSTLADMGYWVDWAALLGLAAAAGGVVAAFAWPLLARRHGRAQA